MSSEAEEISEKVQKSVKSAESFFRICVIRERKVFFQSSQKEATFHKVSDSTVSSSLLPSYAESHGP